MPIRREFNKTFFKKWSPDMAYILGFLFADGNIVKTKRGTYFTSIYTSDRELLITMRDCLRSGHAISARRSPIGVVYRMQIGSRELFEDLVKGGLTPNKSRRMRLPAIPKKYTGHFIRGYFDGDGNVWSGDFNKKRKKSTRVLIVSFTCASDLFLKNLHHKLKKSGIKGGFVYRIKLKKCSRLSLSTIDSLKLFKIMYTGSHKLFLPRKKLIFEKFIAMRP